MSLFAETGQCRGVSCQYRLKPSSCVRSGSSCQVPEQTVQAFKLAIENGADFLGITVVSCRCCRFSCCPLPSPSPSARALRPDCRHRPHTRGGKPGARPVQVSTKDGALVCRPDITLDGNTNIAQDKSLRGRDSVQVRAALWQCDAHAPAPAMTA